MSSPFSNSLPMTPSTPDEESIKSFRDMLDDVKPAAQSRLEDTPFGPWKKIERLDKHEKIYLVACYTALTISLIMTLQRLFSQGLDDTDSTYGMMLICATGFSFFYVTTGVFQEQPHEMLAFCATNVIVLVYVIVNLVSYSVNNTERGETFFFKLARVLFTTLFSLVLIPIGFYQARKYYTHRTLLAFAIKSASTALQDMAQTLFIFGSTITFDLQLELNLLILVMKEGIGAVSKDDLAILIVGLVITIVWTIVGRLAARLENKALVIAFLVLSIPNLVYAGYKFYVASNDSSDDLFKITILSGVLAVIVRLATLWLLFKVYSNFGKGLKESIYKWDQAEPQTSVQPSPASNAISASGSM